VTSFSNQGSIRVELHQALGLKYQPLGFCQIRCHDLIGASGGKFQGRGQLGGMEPLLSSCVDVGSVEYWMKLKLPITHSAKWYQVGSVVEGGRKGGGIWECRDMYL